MPAKATSSTTGGAKSLVPGRKDIVIMLMGQTGAGKSSFFNELFLGTGIGAQVGRSLTACTAAVQHAVAPEDVTRRYSRIRKHRIMIVDTPGFNDTYKDDIVILRTIGAWLKSHDVVIGGIIYLHDISDQETKVTGTTQTTLGMLKGLCGQDALDRASIVFSKGKRGAGWTAGREALAEEIGKRWQPKTTWRRWEPDAGDGDSAVSARDIVHSILARVQEEHGEAWRPLKFQSELAMGLPVDDTDAGRILPPPRADEIAKAKKEFSWSSFFSKIFRPFRSKKKSKV